MLARQHAKLFEWIRRYAGPEICGTITAMSAAWIVLHLSHSVPAMAIAGTIAETIGYYGYAGWREVAFQYRQHRHKPWPARVWLTIVRTVRDMIIEYGPGEILDFFFVRPYLMWQTPLHMHSPMRGALVGKLLADVVFYVFVILAYELKKAAQNPGWFTTQVLALRVIAFSAVAVFALEIKRQRHYAESLTTRLQGWWQPPDLLRTGLLGSWPEPQAPAAFSAAGARPHHTRASRPLAAI